nr:CHAT domain-containing protein [Dendronalium sp. ChiSLP03b]MDZ8206573.1 CHAT domain-containing protein [Dendronalium sp. ChiSLP03b]
MNPIKILILTANPSNTGSDSLCLDAEVRRIEEALQRSHYRDRFQITAKLAVRTTDLRRALLDHKPQIVHFSGHGTGEQGLVLENDAGKVQLVSTEALAGLFGIFETGDIECVLLNACYSEIQATAIHQFVDCVIGMNQPIADKSAVQFAEGFYDALGAGSPYEEAYKIGCSAIALEGSSEYSTPVLKNRKRRDAPLPGNQTVSQSLQPERVPAAIAEPPARWPQSQAIGNVTISGSNNPFNAIQAGGNVRLSQSGTQRSDVNLDLEAALALLVKLKKEVSATDVLSSFARKDTESKIGMLQEELQKPKPDKNFVNEVVVALKQGLSGVLTLAALMTQVADLVAKAWDGLL